MTNHGQHTNNLFLLFFMRQIRIINTKQGAQHEKNSLIIYNCLIYYTRRQRVPGYIVQRTGAERCEKSKRGCKMHHRHGSCFQSNLFTASLCKMHRHWHEQTLWRLATVAWFTQPIKTIFRLEICGICMLSRQGPALSNNFPAPAGFFIPHLLW